MIRSATHRLMVAVTATVVGAMVAVVGGLPEAAILVAPWAVVLVLGLSNSDRGEPSITVDLATDRVLVADEIEVVTSVTGAAGSVHVQCLPNESFWPRVGGGEGRRAEGKRDVLAAARATVRCALPAMQWGTHDVGHVQVVVDEPYGLFRREGPAGQAAFVRVHPTQGELRKLLAPRLVRRVSGVHGSRVVGRGVEFADIRPFSSGDSLRDINWRASARTTELWVSQRHPDQATDVILLLDSFVESGHDVHTVFGFAIEAAVALAESHLAATDRVGLVELGGIVRWVKPGTGKLQLQRLADAMLSTGLFANAGRRDLLRIPTRVLPPRSFVLAITPLLDDRFIDALFVLGGRGHDVAVIECASTDLTSSLEATSDLSQLVDRIWHADRQVIRDRLAKQGIAVAGWSTGGSLDATLAELTGRRQRPIHARRP